MSTGPRTKAGKALLEMLSNLAADLPLEFGDEPLERLDMEATLRIILAIEAEAAERSAGAAPIDVERLIDSLGPYPQDPELRLLARLWRSAGAAPCDRIVNNGMGEPTECGHTFPCEYHDERSAGAAPLDVERLAEAMAVNGISDGDGDPLFDVAERIAAEYACGMDVRPPRRRDQPMTDQSRSGAAPIDVPDYQYEMLEEIAKAGWMAAFPEVATGKVVTRKSIDAWFRFMKAATLEMEHRRFAFARLSEGLLPASALPRHRGADGHHPPEGRRSMSNTNEAAERLRGYWTEAGMIQTFGSDLDAALAHERSAGAAAPPARIDAESVAELLAVEMAVAGYADPDPTEQYRAPIEAARSILARLEQRGYHLAHERSAVAAPIAVEALRLEFIEARDSFDEDSDSWAVWNVAAESLSRLEPSSAGAAPLGMDDPRWCHDSECPLYEQGIWGHPVSAHPSEGTDR